MLILESSYTKRFFKSPGTCPDFGLTLAIGSRKL